MTGARHLSSLEYDRCVFEVGWRRFGAWKLPFFFFFFLFFFKALGMDRLIKWINVWQLGVSGFVQSRVTPKKI